MLRPRFPKLSTVSQAALLGLHNIGVDFLQMCICWGRKPQADHPGHPVRTWRNHWESCLLVHPIHRAKGSPPTHPFLHLNDPPHSRLPTPSPNQLPADVLHAPKIIHLCTHLISPEEEEGKALSRSHSSTAVGLRLEPRWSPSVSGPGNQGSSPRTHSLRCPPCLPLGQALSHGETRMGGQTFGKKHAGSPWCRA